MSKPERVRNSGATPAGVPFRYWVDPKFLPAADFIFSRDLGRVAERLLNSVSNLTTDSTLRTNHSAITDWCAGLAEQRVNGMRCTVRIREGLPPIKIRGACGGQRVMKLYFGPSIHAGAKLSSYAGQQYNVDGPGSFDHSSGASSLRSRDSSLSRDSRSPVGSGNSFNRSYSAPYAPPYSDISSRHRPVSTYRSYL